MFDFNHFLSLVNIKQNKKLCVLIINFNYIIGCDPYLSINICYK